MDIEILHFSKLNTTQLYQLLQLRSEVFVVEQNCVYLDMDDKDHQAFHIFIKEQDRPIAYARLLPKGISYKSYCSIGRVLTKSNYRHKNIGRKLMEESINFCIENFGCDIKISAQSYLEKFYTDLGFEKITEEYMEDNIPHIGMLYQML